MLKKANTSLLNNGAGIDCLLKQPPETPVKINPAGLRKENYHGILPNIPPITKLIGEYLLPEPAKKQSSQMLFMLSLTAFNGQVHALARGMGDQRKTGYQSTLIHAVGVNTAGGHHIQTEDRPLLPGKNREDPRLTRIGDTYYFTNTIVQGERIMVGLGSTKDFRKYRDHGVIIPPLDEELTCKDPVIFPNTGSPLLMQVRLKPGIQLVKFESMDDLLELGENPKKRRSFWNNMVTTYRQDNGAYDYLTPAMKEMKPFEEAWKPALDTLVKQKLLPNHPHRKMLRPNPEQDKVWYGPGPSPIMLEEGWLDLPHRAQLKMEYSTRDRKRLRDTGWLADDVKMYCVFATLRDLKNPQKIIAVSPVPISTPEPDNQQETEISRKELAVPYVKITSGAMKVEVDGKPHLMLATGIHDQATKIEYLQLYGKGGLIPWMLQHGRV